MLKWALFMWQRTAASVSDLFTICNLFLFVINRGMYSAEIHWNYLLSHLFLSAKMTKYLFFFFVFKGFEIKDWVLKTQWQWQYILTTLSDIHHHLISLWQPDSTYLFVLNVSRCMDVLQRRVRWTLFFCPLLYPYSLSPDRLLILWKKKSLSVHILQKYLYSALQKDPLTSVSFAILLHLEDVARKNMSDLLNCAADLSKYQTCQSKLPLDKKKQQQQQQQQQKKPTISVWRCFCTQNLKRTVDRERQMYDSMSK